MQNVLTSTNNIWDNVLGVHLFSNLWLPTSKKQPQIIMIPTFRPKQVVAEMGFKWLQWCCSVLKNKKNWKNDNLMLIVEVSSQRLERRCMVIIKSRLLQSHHFEEDITGTA